MSRIRADQITNKGANGAPNFPNGLVVTGVVTATVSSSTLASLSVTGDATIGGNLGVAGTITYEDVARVDATGISTFREGFGVGPLAGIALTAYKDGSIRTSGIITANTYYGSGANLTGIDATQIQTGNTSVQTVDTGSDGHVKITTEGSERARIDNVGRMGLLTNSPGSWDAAADDFVINGSGNTGLTINSGSAGTTNQGNIAFAEGTGGSADKFRGAIQYKHGDDQFRIFANNTERIRIGSSGEIGVGGGGSISFGSAGQFLRSGGNSAGCTWAGAGVLLKVQRAATSSQVTHPSNGTFIDTGLSMSFTATASNSTLYIMGGQNAAEFRSGGCGWQFQLQRDGTNLISNSRVMTGSNELSGTHFYCHSMSAGDTSAHTFKTRTANHHSGSSGSAQYSATQSTMIIFEIAA